MSNVPALPTQPVDEAATGEALRRFRQAAPLVHCITNSVVTGWTANVLLASGAAPAMVDNPHEAGAFARVASAVVINLGTPHDHTVAAMQAAAQAADDAGIAWVLDPVAVGPLAWRTQIAHDLLTKNPVIVRGNASEINALGGGGGGGRGPETVAAPEDALAAAQALAAAGVGSVAVSGPQDHVIGGTDLIRLTNGHPWLTKVTGVGCALGELMAGYAAVCPALLAAAAATAHLTVAADMAVEKSHGPGSFAVALLDHLEALSPEELASRVSLR